jgi:hypothetical protein
MIARRSFQAKQVAIEHIDREITISPKKVEKTYELRGEAQNKSQQMEPKSGGEVRGEVKEVTDEGQDKDGGEIESESGGKERKGKAQRRKSLRRRRGRERRIWWRGWRILLRLGRKRLGGRGVVGEGLDYCKDKERDCKDAWAGTGF